MKKIFLSIFVILLCLCVFSLLITGKPVNFNTLVYFANSAPSSSVSISSWVASVTIPYITTSWDLSVVNFNPLRDFINSCVTAINVVWRPLSFVFGGLKYVVEWWSFVLTYFFS